MMLSIPFFFRPSVLKSLHFLPQNSLLSASAVCRTTFARRRLAAIGPDGKYYPSPVNDDPPEANEDTAHGVSKFQQIYRQASRTRKLQEERFEQDKSLFLSALAAEPDARSSPPADASGDDFFGEIDLAITLKRQDFVKQGLLKPPPPHQPHPQAPLHHHLHPTHRRPPRPSFPTSASSPPPPASSVSPLAPAMPPPPPSPTASLTSLSSTSSTRRPLSAALTPTTSPSSTLPSTSPFPSTCRMCCSRARLRRRWSGWCGAVGLWCWPWRGGGAMPR